MPAPADGRKISCKKKTGNFCCVPGCCNAAGKDQLLGTRRSYFKFPHGDQKRLKAWKAAIPRDQWNPSANSRICSDHFVGGKW